MTLSKASDTVVWELNELLAADRRAKAFSEASAAGDLSARLTGFEEAHWQNISSETELVEDESDFEFTEDAGCADDEAAADEAEAEEEADDIEETDKEGEEMQHSLSDVTSKRVTMLRQVSTTSVEEEATQLLQESELRKRRL